MKFDPESYSITIRKEEIDNEILYVGRVAEFPNISVYEENFETARAGVSASAIAIGNLIRLTIFGSVLSAVAAAVTGKRAE